MKKIIHIALIITFLTGNYAMAQVKTSFSHETISANKGLFLKNYSPEVDFELPAMKIDSLLVVERKNILESNEIQAFRLAKALPLNLNIAQQLKWNNDKEFSYGKYKVRLNGALSTSINFDKFYLPQKTEMFIYNQDGSIVTGPITEKENNSNGVWGSWVYKGEFLTIEIKTPIATVKDLVLHANNIAYGYKEVYKTQVGGFGQSAPCNINVLCPLGTGWEAERNSVALVLNDNGEVWCSGAMIMNTCNTNRPFFLTANHCFNPPGRPQQNVTNWRFTFQAWSATCTPSQNSDGVTYNGSTLRANWAGTDMCLVELNNTPPVNSGINYAGWNRNTNGITQETIIHHPRGDVMKITRDNDAPVFDNFLGAQCWRLIVDQGTTEGGSSGSPYFDQNRRIIGQHYGIDDGNLPVCNQVRKFGGRFDLSWTGGGTNATRLSNWLDPANTNQLTTNTTNIANLQPAPSIDVNSLAISGPQIICNSSDYSITNLPTGATVAWSIPGSAGPVLQLSPNTPAPNQLRITNQKWYTVTTTLTAIISNLGCGIPNQTRVLTIANDNSTSASQPHAYFQEACTFYNVSHPSQSGTIFSNSSPVFVHQGCMVYVNLENMTGRTVTLGSGGTPLFWAVGSTSYYQNSLYFQLPLGSGGIPFTFNINGNGACFQKTLLFFSYTGNARYAFAATPNPTKDQLIVTAKEDEKYLPENKLNSTKEKLQFIMNVYDVNTNTLQITERSGSGNTQHRLNVSRLKPGYYVLQIVNGKEIQSIKFFKE
ncbi:MAG: hypothetical protein K2X48_17765 [Chitinophagaceae bacterium]|nr:hypothetical protein [Chitinophagaceae bacterium]